jgi:hypothetical protein
MTFWTLYLLTLLIVLLGIMVAGFIADEFKGGEKNGKSSGK